LGTFGSDVTNNFGEILFGKPVAQSILTSTFLCGDAIDDRTGPCHHRVHAERLGEGRRLPPGPAS
jgi:hypothetical protein